MLIHAAISKLVQGCPVIVVAHRLRTVAGADNIVVLGNGAVVEQGQNQELLEKKAYSPGSPHSAG